MCYTPQNARTHAVMHIRHDLPLTFPFHVSIITNTQIQAQIILKAKSVSLFMALSLHVYIEV